MFERFTDQARRVVVVAQEESRKLGHDYIGTEHILLGILGAGESVAVQALASLGVSLEAAREQVEEIVGRGSHQVSGHIPFTPRAKKVLELSLREAIQLGHNYIGTEHILLGLIREGEGVAAQVLDPAGRGSEPDPPAGDPAAARTPGRGNRRGVQPAAAPARRPGRAGRDPGPAGHDRRPAGRDREQARHRRGGGVDRTGAAAGAAAGGPAPARRADRPDRPGEAGGDRRPGLRAGRDAARRRAGTAAAAGRREQPVDGRGRGAAARAPTAPSWTGCAG